MNSHSARSGRKEILASGTEIVHFSDGLTIKIFNDNESIEFNCRFHAPRPFVPGEQREEASVNFSLESDVIAIADFVNVDRVTGNIIFPIMNLGTFDNKYLSANFCIGQYEEMIYVAYSFFLEGSVG
jgi:hypothetical protein